MPISGHGDKWLQNFVPYLMYRITNQLNRRIRSRLRKSDINITRWRVLGTLRAYGELSLGRIVELTAMEQPSVSRVVAQLEREGLAKREISTNDSRFVNVTLTPAGVKAFQAIYPTAQRHQERALSGFSKKEINTLKSFLRRIQTNIEAEE
ncbi:MAG: MarR family winged helix-turn-helix transcriptional regulator [Woeseiaceae bacterium]